VDQVNSAHFIGKDLKNLSRVIACCPANISVGAKNTAWYLFSLANKAAERATTVLPDPTSP
jgi:hypothetical protein